MEAGREQVAEGGKDGGVAVNAGLSGILCSSAGLCTFAPQASRSCDILQTVEQVTL